MNHRIACFKVATLSILVLAAPLPAAPIGPGQTVLNVNAIQSLRLLPNTFLNPGPDPIELGDVEAASIVPYDRQAQVGSSIDFQNGTFFGTGFIPGLGPFELFSGVVPMNMQVTNVVQDPGDPGFATGDPSSFVSGDAVWNIPDYGARVAGVELTVKDPFFFATLDGLPPSVGTQFTADPFAEPDGILNIFAIDPNTSQEVIVAHSFNRRLVQIPEPSSLRCLALLCTCIVGLVGARKFA